MQVSWYCLSQFQANFSKKDPICTLDTPAATIFVSYPINQALAFTFQSQAGYSVDKTSYNHNIVYISAVVAH